MGVDYYHAGMNAYDAGRFEEAYSWFMNDENDPKCAYALGVLFYNGQGVERDYGTSTRYYTVAAEAGIIPAQVSAGFAYANALGVPQDFEKAAKYLKPASDAGETAATVTLAEIYAQGEGGGSRAEAARLLRNVLAHGNSEEAMEIYSRYELHKVF